MLVATDFRHSKLKQFINLITSDQQTVDESLQSCTSEVSFIEATVGGESVVVIDTPGFTNTHSGVSDIDVLTEIANILCIM